MNKWFLIVIVAMLLMVGCTSSRTALKADQATMEPYTGLVTKVAILPLKSMDSQSRYIEKILTVRDLNIAFAKHQKYELMNMDEVASEYKITGFQDVDALELEEMAEIAEMTKCDILVMGSISSIRGDTFAIAMRLFSPRTSELRQLNFNVTKDKFARWASLETSMMGDLDKFVSNETDKIFNIATNNYSTGNYAEAEKSLKLALALNPELKDAQYYLGATYFKSGKLDEAIVSLNKNVEKEPDHLPSLLMLMDVYEQSNQALNRLEVMEKIATLNNDEELWLAIANLWVEQENIPKAEAALLQAISIEPDFALAQSRLALLLFDEGRYADAIPYLEFAFDRYPENDLISRRLAVAYQKSNRMDEAIAKYELVIKNNPSNPQAYLSVVGLYRIQASEATDPKDAAAIYQKAIGTLNTLIKNQPDNALPYVNLASIYMTQSKFAEVETNSNLAIQRDPSLYLPYVYLGTVSQNKGTNDYNRFAELEKQAAKAVGKKANTLKKDRDNARLAAVANFRKAADYLNQAKSRATEGESINDINSRLARINQLISSASSL
ncbi:MAG: tetratricopeptide repeat protein [Candidatus Cloacimonetes bacterium]|nr:tetratricopeptide repeat protein [Candidatus Cloacimonadota bacterium]